MDRKDFIQKCGMGCLGLVLGTSFLEGCTTAKKATAYSFSGDDLVVPLSNFGTAEAKGGYRKFLIISDEQMRYPICVFRFDADHYEALLMRCTHQGAELQLFGDRFECPAHGSEFDDHGIVKTGPADQNLRRFPVTIETGQLRVSLKAGTKA